MEKIIKTCTCAKCGATSEVEFQEDQDIEAIVKDYICPECASIPVEASEGSTEAANTIAAALGN